jgi:C1A family cysteine protease
MNALPSPLDERDYIAESIYPSKKQLKLPKTLDLRKDLQPIRNQGSQGTCAAQVGSCIKEWQEKKDIKLNEYMSPQFIYNNRENYPNSGMYGRDVMKILKNKGCCREHKFLYGKYKNKNYTSLEAEEDAKNFKILAYARVTTIEGLKKALYKNGPCYISFPTYDKTKNFWKQKKQDQKRLGGHAVTVVGYDKKGFILRNSWSVIWGDYGYTLYPYEDFGSHWEIWTTIDEKSKNIDKKFMGKLIKIFTLIFCR